MAILGAGMGRLMLDDLVRGARGYIRNRAEEPHVRQCGTNMGHPSKSESKTAAKLRQPAWSGRIEKSKRAPLKTHKGAAPRFLLAR
jgi:hypothetical protein